MARRSRIFERLDAVLDPRQRRSGPGRRSLLLAAAVLLLITVPLALLGPAADAKLASRGRIIVERLDRDGPVRFVMPELPRLPALPEMPQLPEFAVLPDLRDLPRIPELPALPDLAALPGIDALPALPELPAISSLPALPELPTLPALPALGSIHLNRGDGRVEIRIHDDDTDADLRLDLEGPIEFDEQGTEILHMGEDAYFKIEQRRDGERISVEAEPGEGGEPVYTYKLGRRRQPFDQAAAAWLSEVLELTLLELGVDADLRVQRAYADGGAGAVLALIERVDSEHSRGVYYREFFRLEGPPDGELAAVLDRLTDDIDSDYEKAAVLRAFADRRLETAGVHPAFLRCLRSIDSDYELAGILESGLEIAEELPVETVAALLAAAEEVDSDYETARALQALDNDLLADPTVRAAYFDALDGIDSDYEKARLIKGLARAARRDPALREVALEAAEGLDSDYEYRQVIDALR
jgi:hypothetical protein